MNQEEYQVRKLARDLSDRIAKVERKLRSTAAASADLRHSSIDGGKGLTLKDADGNVTYRLGTDPITGSTVPEFKGGPVPAQPAPAFVDFGDELLKVQLSGLDADGNPAPSDFRVAEVHVKLNSPVFEPSRGETFAVHIEEPNGSVTHRLPGGEWWVGIVWVTLSGKRSVMSETVVADIPARVDADDLLKILAEAERLMEEAKEYAELLSGELDDGLIQLAADLADAVADLDAARQLLEPLPAQVAAAQSEAAAAKATADQAVDDALAAAGVADSKAQFFAQISAPSGGRRKAGNLWMRLPDYKLHYFDEAEDKWVVSTDADLIAAAESAADALDEADALKSRAAALELAVDGEGGLRDRLSGAEQLLEDKADDSDLSELDRRLSDRFGQIESHYSRIWPRSETPPPSGTHYAWLGERDASVSVRLDGDGNETARNLFRNSSFSGGTAEWDNWSGASIDVNADGNLVVTYPGNPQTNSGATQSVQIGAGDEGTYTMTAKVRRSSEDIVTRFQINTHNFTHNQALPLQPPVGEWGIISYTFNITNLREGNNSVYIFGNVAGAEGTLEIEWAMLEKRDTFGDYFDGSTASDRANDLWYNTDGVPHEWVNGQGWVELSDARIEQLNTSVSELSTAASNAQATADQAVQDALDAANIAEGKGQVITQISAPTGSRADSKNLWVRLPDFKVHIYDTGQAKWVAATDPDLIAAAQVAANALQEAQDAHAVAGTAQSTANSALTMAGSKSKVTYSTSAPAGTATVGDTHRQQDSNGDITAEWEYTAAGWRKRAITSEAVSNLDVGKLTAGTAEIIEAVLEKVWVGLGVFNRIKAEAGLIGNVNLENGAVTAEKITASREMITKLFATEWAYVSQQLVVAGNLITENIDAITAQLGTLTVTERANFSQAFAEEMFAAQGVFDRLQAAIGWIGNVMLKDGSVTTEKIVFTEELVGNIAELLHLVVDRIDANGIWADTAWLTAVETANVRLRSVIGDWQTILSGRGMEVISPEGQPTVQLGNFEETGLTLYRHDTSEDSNEATASITDDGAISGTVISANDEFYYQGTELSEMLDIDDTRYALGVISERVFAADRATWYTETGVGYVGFLAVPGRRYKITVTGEARDTLESRGFAVRIRLAHTANESIGFPEPSISDELLQQRVFRPETNQWTHFHMTTTWEYPNPELSANKPTRVLVTLAPRTGTGSCQWRSGGQVIVEDVGLTPASLSGWHDGGAGGGTPPAEPTPIKRRRTATFTMDWWRVWWQNGNIPSSGIGTREVAQGRTPYFTTAGLYRSMVGFPSMTSTLSGADIEKIEVRVRVTHTHSGRGGRVRLGVHGLVNRPTHFAYNDLELTNTQFSRSQEKWVTLPSSTHAGFKNGQHRGIIVYSSSTSTDFYVQMRPSRFAIRVTYRA